jgi:HD-GYP domain-containing protein (c-di-GMP phosphodiesterase class II)
MLEPIPFLHPALDIAFAHHEKWDGSGYPRGIQRTEIPLPARIFAIIDVWDAMQSDRPYRKAFPNHIVIREIESQSGHHFDPQVVEEFMILVNQGEIRRK